MAGDLPDLVVNSDGRGQKTIFIKEVTSRPEGFTSGLFTIYDTDGTSLVIHASPDDQLTDLSDNSGDRIACGVIQPGF